MAVTRQGNFLGDQRIDVNHLRLVESGVAGDFDVLAGIILAGKQPLITAGFNLITTGITRPEQLQLKVAGGSMIHYMASDSGSIFSVPAAQAPEVLNSSNPNITGGFVPSQVNYIGVDLVRTIDDSTADLVMFIDPTSLAETGKNVPLSRILNYRIIISVVDFNSTPTLAPIAKVTTNANNDIVLIEDARNIFWRLGSGGTVPNKSNFYTWPTGRNETTYVDLFLGADKSLGSLKDWVNATMSRIWELGGGEFWYSPTADRNVKLAIQGSNFSNGEWFEYVSSNLHWKGLVFLFDNSTGFKNEVLDQASDHAGLTDLADGECVYVDVDRTQNRTGGSGLQAVKSALTTLGPGAVPGSRYILAWRFGSSIFTRLNSNPVGTGTLTPATTLANGVVSVSATPNSPSQPFATLYDTANQWAAAGGVSRSSTGFTGGSGDINIGKPGGTGLDQYIHLNPGTGRNVNLISDYIQAGSGMLTVQSTASMADNTPQISLSVFGKKGGSNGQQFTVDVNGAVGFSIAPVIVATPVPGGGDNIAAKAYLRTVGTTPNARTQYVILDVDGIETVIWQGLPH